MYALGMPVTGQVVSHTQRRSNLFAASPLTASLTPPVSFSKSSHLTRRSCICAHVDKGRGYWLTSVHDALVEIVNLFV